MLHHQKLIRTAPRTLCALFAVVGLLGATGCAAPGAWGRPTPPPSAEPVPPPPPPGPHLFSISIGAAFWPELGDVDPTSSGFSPDDFGEFEEWGGSFAMTYHHRVAEFETGALWLGGDLAVSSFENKRSFDVFTLPSGRTIDGTYSANLIRFSPSLLYRVPLAERVTGFIGGGFGLYSISLIEEFDGFSDDIDSDTTFGGFLSLGFDFRIADSPFSIRLEEQMHFVDLDAFESTIPADSSVDGPIHHLLFGVAIQI